MLMHAFSAAAILSRAPRQMVALFATRPSYFARFVSCRIILFMLHIFLRLEQQPPIRHIRRYAYDACRHIMLRRLPFAFISSMLV